MIGLCLCTPVLHAQLTYLPAEPPARPDPVVAGRIKVRVASEYAHRAADVLREMGLTIEREMLPRRASLTWKKQHGQEAPQTIINDRALVLEERLLRTFVVSYNNPAIPPERMIGMIHPGCGPIECAAPWCVMELCSEPNDPEAPKQNLLKQIGVFDAWDVEDGSDSVVIGISDSGLRQDHEDLKDALLLRTTEIPANGVDDDNNGYIDDYNGYSFTAEGDGTPYGETFNPNNGHGTSVAGTCGATVNNGIGIAGIANKCKMFPLRTMPNGSSGIVFGYESIIYCATNGFAVVNCSWGGQSPSCIDEDVIAYAIARGTAVVAAAGNHGSPAPFYPASYPGVLGVGVVNYSDDVVPMTGHGPSVDIMAPGHSSWTTDNGGGYSGFCCTSGSAPIASGVVALVRAKNPQLTPIEACAVVRESATRNPWATVPSSIHPLLLPEGRINALAAVRADPSTMVSLAYDTVSVRGPNGAPRWTLGDTIEATVRLRNELASYINQSIDSIQLVPSTTPGVELLGSNTRTYRSSAGHDSTFSLAPLSFVVTRATDTMSYVSFSLSGTNAQGTPTTHRLRAGITPSPAFTTLSNPVMHVSIGDRGRIGNTDIQRGQGEGLSYLGYCGQLYEGGLVATANGRVVDNVRGARGIDDHFRAVKGFIKPNPELGVVQDLDAPDSIRLGIQVEQRIVLDSLRGMVIIDVTLTNISDTTLNDLALGWFCDWDLGKQPARNRSFASSGMLFVESIDAGSPAVVQYVQSDWSDAMPVLHGMDNTSTYSGFEADRKRSLLMGKEAPFTGINDIATMVGMRFSRPLPPRHVRNFRHVIAIDTNRVALNALAGTVDANLVRRTYSPWVSGPIDKLFPNPASNYVHVPVQGATPMAEIVMYDMQGRQILQMTVGSTTPTSIVPVDIGSLASGVYWVRTPGASDVRTYMLVVAR